MKNDKLLESIKSIMANTDKLYVLSEKLNSDLGITSRKAIPNENLRDYDELLGKMMTEQGSFQGLPGSGLKPKVDPPPAPAMSSAPGISPSVPVGQKQLTPRPGMPSFLSKPAPTASPAKPSMVSRVTGAISKAAGVVSPALRTPGAIPGSINQDYGSDITRASNAVGLNKVLNVPATPPNSSISKTPVGQGPNPVPGPAVKPITPASSTPINEPVAHNNAPLSRTVVKNTGSQTVSNQAQSNGLINKSPITSNPVKTQTISPNPLPGTMMNATASPAPVQNLPPIPSPHTPTPVSPTVTSPPSAPKAEAPTPTPETNSRPESKPEPKAPAPKEKKTISQVRDTKPDLPWGQSQKTRDEIFKPDTGN